MGTGRITRAKAAEVAQKSHVDGDGVLGWEGEREREEGGGVTMQEDLSMNRSPLAEIAGNRPGSGSGLDSGENSSADAQWKASGRKSLTRRCGGVQDGEETAVNEPVSSSPGVADKTTIATTSTPDKSRKKNEKNADDDETAKEHKSQPEDDENGHPSFASQHANATPASPIVESSHAQSHQEQDNSPKSPSCNDSSTIIETGETSVTKNTMPPNTLQRSGSPISAPSTPNQHQRSDMSKPKYDVLEAAAIEAQTPPREKFASPPPRDAHASPPPSQDSISALDELDDAVEAVNAHVSKIPPSPLKAPKAIWEKPAPAVRTTKASQARMSLAHGPKDATSRAPALGRPRQSMSLAGEGRRVTSSSSLKSSQGTTAKEEVPPARKAIEIPHSKPRPMSMSFPAPRPPPKSSKPVTVSNFTLPGEAMSAKFRAAREAKAKLEAEEKARRVFKARPAPTQRAAPAAVRQTSTSKARESLMGKPASGNGAPGRANSVASSRPAVSTSSKPKTTSTAEATEKRSTVPTAAVKVPQRASTAMGLLNKSKVATQPGTAQRQDNRVPSLAGTSTKGKEVFGRTVQAKVLAEREKKEREEAAKKARHEAAERSRNLSREWAEKQKVMKKGGSAT